MEELKETISLSLRRQQIQEGMAEHRDICQAYYGKLYLLRQYNIILITNKRKNAERRDFIPNCFIWEKLISTNTK